MTTNKQLPVILCHAACTGGSFIYRTLLSTFNLCGVCEIGHHQKPRISGFYPLDPVAQQFLQEELSYEQFGEVLLDRLAKSEQIAHSQGSRLLIREHTHSYFFEPDEGPELPESPSWVMSQYKIKRETVPPVIVSIRNPIDSWLGFRRNFPLKSPTDFSDYCRLYNGFLDRIDAAKSEGDAILVIRYEELVANIDNTLASIATFVGAEYQGVDYDKMSVVVSSGSSGRQSNVPAARARRPFTSSLVKQAKSCPEYQRLCERLDYRLFFDGLTTKERLTARFYQLAFGLGRLTLWIDRPARWAHNRLRSLRNRR